MENTFLCKTRFGIKQIFPLIYVVIAYIIDLWYEIGPGKYNVDGDLAAEMLLSKLLNDEHAILSTNWYYSTELRVFNMQWLYRIGLLLFPNDYHAARVVASAIAYAVLGMAVFFMMYFATRKVSISLYVAGTALYPIGQIYLVYGLFGKFYLMNFAYAAIILAFIFRFIGDKRNRLAWVNILGIAVFSACYGVTSVKAILTLAIPLVCTAGILALLSLRQAVFQSEDDYVGIKNLFSNRLLRCEVVRLLIATLTLLISTCIGYAYNVLILAKKYTYQNYGKMHWSKIDDFSLLKEYRDFFHLFGYSEDLDLFSARGIASGIGLLIGILLIISIIRLLLRFKELRYEYQIIILSLVCGLIVDGIIYGYWGHYFNYYWLTLFVFAIPTFWIEIYTECYSVKESRSILSVTLAIAFVITSIFTIKEEVDAPFYAAKGLYQAKDWLLENEYYNGYGEFWVSDNLTEMSNGKIKMWIYDGDSEITNLVKWLQYKDRNDTAPTGKTFAIFDKNKPMDVKPEDAIILNENAKVEYETPEIVVYTWVSE